MKVRFTLDEAFVYFFNRETTYSDVTVEITRKELAEFKRVAKAFWKWQQLLQEREEE